MPVSFSHEPGGLFCFCEDKSTEVVLPSFGRVRAYRSENPLKTIKAYRFDGLSVLPFYGSLALDERAVLLVENFVEEVLSKTDEIDAKEVVWFVTLPDYEDVWMEPLCAFNWAVRVTASTPKDSSLYTMLPLDQFEGELYFIDVVRKHDVYRAVVSRTEKGFVVETAHAELGGAQPLCAV